MTVTTTDYDIIVIGAGSAGLSVSLFTGKIGLRTLLIDRTERAIGGDCLNHGCIPSKALIHVARILNNATAARDFGISVSGKPDFEKVKRYIREAQEKIRQHENSEYLQSHGIDVVLGEAQFYDRASVVVNKKIYRGRKIIIATGSRPSSPDIKGIEKVNVLDNESIFQIKELPPRILVLGGGPVGMEMAQAMARLGVHVTVVGRNRNILPHDPPDITTILFDRLSREGIVLHTGSEVTEFTDANTALIRTPEGNKVSIHFDTVLNATGRRVNISSLRPEKAGVQIKNGRMLSDVFLRTTNRNIYVCGDVTGNHMFSHAAEYHARVLLNNMFSPFKKHVRDEEMSWVTFTDPQVATFGLSEKWLGQKGIRFQKLCYDFDRDDRAVTDDYVYGKLVLFVSRKNVFGKQKLLGGSMIAPNAGEMIQELILARNESLALDALFDKLYPYPVSSRVNQLGIIKHKEQQLTPGVKKLLRFLFRKR